ncbi:MAG: PD40 domain-containing protein, partial [Candidatus Eremiobacteraeota bacterium]|nr:PD40 domain-containing protein [Candidatus Eremiobacteraeota bacterium]
IFADWNDKPTTKSGPQFFGRFSVPNGEPERMEFYPEFDWNENGLIDGDDERDIWRSVWTWTPPPAAEAGDLYTLQVDVKDAKFEKEVSIKDIPPVAVAPPGEIVFERDHAGRSHLFTMWADGSQQRKLTKGPYDYSCPSATADGKVIAFQRNSEVWIMNFDGTGQTKVANGQLPVISPTGSSIAFMNGSTVTIKRLDSTSGAERTIGTTSTTVAGSPPGPANRMAYSPDGRVLYITGTFTDETGAAGGGVTAVRLDFPGNGLQIASTQDGEVIPNTRNSAKVGGLYADRLGRYLYYHGDEFDPYIGRYPLAAGTYALQPINDVTDVRKSVAQNEAYPTPSPDGNLMLFTEGNNIYTCPIGSFNAAGAQTFLTTGRRPAWLKQRGSF